MLESLLIRRTEHSDTENPIDLGFLCESMLFYQNVVVLADHVIAKQLIRRIGADTLLALVDMGALRIHYSAKRFGLANNSDNTKRITYTPIQFALKSDRHDLFQKTIFEKEGKLGRSRRLSQRLAAVMPVTEADQSVEKSFIHSIQDHEYVKTSICDLLAHLLKTDKVVSGFDYRLEIENGTVCFVSNLDFGRINDEFHKYVPPSHTTINDAYLLCHLLDVQSDLWFAADFEAEIATDPKYQLLQQLELSRAFKKFKKSQETLQTFHETIFPESRDIRSCINTGAQSIDDFLVILEKAQRFKSWLKDKPTEMSLTSAYFKEVTAETWIDKTPVKIARWATLVALGEAISSQGWIAGAALSALDTFYLDKLARRWKPNQFVNGPYRRFLG